MGLTKREFRNIVACKNCLKSKTICIPEWRRRRKVTGKCLFGVWEYNGKQFIQDNLQKIMEVDE